MSEPLTGAEAAIAALTRLFEQGQDKLAQGASTGEARLPMSARYCPEYKRLSGLDDHEAFDAQIREAERAGAIAADRTRQGGDSAGWERLRLLDLDVLAGLLKRPLRHQQFALTRHSLEQSLAHHPVIEQILEHWRLGKAVRGQDMTALSTLLDATRVATAARQAGLVERQLRKESARLFGNSKRIEQLGIWLDILSSGELAATGLSDGEIWAQYGLRKEPQPLLLSGTGRVTISASEVNLCRPYLGLPTRALEHLSLHADFLLSIENLTSFHEFIAVFPRHQGLVVFTGGMPSPSWRHAYAQLLDALPKARLLHWGDIDQGGFRIASKLGDVARMQGRRLMPWMMDPDAVPVALLCEKTTPSAAQLGTMLDWSRRTGWHEVAQSLESRPVIIEQEQLAPVLPPQGSP